LGQRFTFDFFVKTLNTYIMTPEETLKSVEEEMAKAIENQQNEFAGLRTGKASPSLVDNLDINVASYGSVMKLKAIAVVTTPEARTVMVAPFDPSTISDIDKGIREANLGFNPVSDGKTLRIPIPEPTEERRKELVKKAKTYTENTKVRLRACRKDGMDAGKMMKSENILTEDAQKDFEKNVQDITNTFVKKADEAFGTKEKEILTV